MKDQDSWDDPAGAEAYAEAMRAGSLYRQLARGLVELLAPERGARVLDLAAGTGLVSGALFGRVGPEGSVVGFDRAHAMLRVAARELPFDEIRFVAADPAALPFASAAFGGATCSAALWHFPALGRVFEECARVLRPGGRLAFNVPAAQIDASGGPPPAPLMAALAREGERRFGEGPEPAGPVLDAAHLEQLAEGAGLHLQRTRERDLPVSQDELRTLIEVPAFSARLYPDVDDGERRRWVAAAAERVDGGVETPLRWREYLVERG